MKTITPAVKNLVNCNFHAPQTEHNLACGHYEISNRRREGLFVHHHQLF